LSSRVPSLVKSSSRLGKYLTVIEDVGALSSADDLRSLATSVRERLGAEASVVALAAHVDGKPAVIVATSAAARDLGAKAGVLAKQAAGVLGGGGGGKDDLAQGGGSDIQAIGAALSGIAAALDA
jgi:alanyl-tRNA synthetase